MRGPDRPDLRGAELRRGRPLRATGPPGPDCGRAMRFAQLRRGGGSERVSWGLIVTSTVIVVFVAVALLGPLLVHYQHFATNLVARLKPPGTIVDGAAALFGTDQ